MLEEVFGTRAAENTKETSFLMISVRCAPRDYVGFETYHKDVTATISWLLKHITPD